MVFNKMGISFPFRCVCEEDLDKVVSNSDTGTNISSL